MDQTKASVRLFPAPPAACKASDVARFLKSQSILEPGMTCECYLDSVGGYMDVDACDASGVVFDLSASTSSAPATLAVRLARASPPPAAKAPFKQANAGCVGLFAFSLLMGLEATMIAHELMPAKRIKPPYALTWSCYAFFIGGLLQLLVGILEVFRNNVYGCTAFMGFGSFWLANGLQMLIKNYFPDEIPEDLLGEDEWGHAIRTFYLAGFIGTLWFQTLRINKATTLLITVLFFKLVFAAFEESSKTCQWITMVLTWIVSAIAFVLFGLELTNEVYGREVFDLLPWNEHSSESAFAAAGRSDALVNKALALRTAPVKATPML